MKYVILFILILNFNKSFSQSVIVNDTIYLFESLYSGEESKVILSYNMTSSDAKLYERLNDLKKQDDILKKYRPKNYELAKDKDDNYKIPQELLKIEFAGQLYEPSYPPVTYMADREDFLKGEKITIHSN